MEKRNKLYDLITSYGKYNDTLNDIKSYNRADTVNMTEQEMNKFRHIAGPAWLSNYYSPLVVTGLGNLKESKDLLMGRSKEDTIFDYWNNQKGIKIGNEKRGIPQKALFDYIFETEIKPYRGQE